MKGRTNRYAIRLRRTRKSNLISSQTTVKRLPSPGDSERFWEEVNRHNEMSRRELAGLPFERKIEILERLSRIGEI